MNDTTPAMTPAEIAAFRAEENARYATQTGRLDAAMKPWMAFIAENKMTSSQRYAIEAALRKTLTEGDYFANRNVTVEVSIEVGAAGRKHSPNRTFSGTFKVRIVGQEWGGASSWFHVGKRGALSGGGYNHGIVSSEFKF